MMMLFFNKMMMIIIIVIVISSSISIRIIITIIIIIIIIFILLSLWWWIWLFHCHYIILILLWFEHHDVFLSLLAVPLILRGQRWESVTRRRTATGPTGPTGPLGVGWSGGRYTSHDKLGTFRHDKNWGLNSMKTPNVFFGRRSLGWNPDFFWDFERKKWGGEAWRVIWQVMERGDFGIWNMKDVELSPIITKPWNCVDFWNLKSLAVGLKIGVCPDFMANLGGKQDDEASKLIKSAGIWVWFQTKLYIYITVASALVAHLYNWRGLPSGFWGWSEATCSPAASEIWRS